MRRTLVLGWLVFLAGVFALLAAGTQPAPASASLPEPPNVPCTFTGLSFNLSGVGTPGSNRPLAVQAGDTFPQFLAPPITATAASTASVIVNNSFSGTVSGGPGGTFSMANLTGLLVTAPEGTTNPRGYQFNEVVITGASGTITAVMGINVLAGSANPPYYPRGFNGYLHSTSTSGAYAGQRFTGFILGSISSFGGTLTLVANITGRLYTGGDTLSETLAGVRSVPANRATTFEPGDIIAQFTRPDFAVEAAVPGHVTLRSELAGTAFGTIDGGFLLEHNAFIVDSGTNTGRGALVGQFTFSDANGDLLTGPWLSDATNNAVTGYLFQIGGTGIYTDSLLFGTLSGNFLFGGGTFAGSVSGVYCEGSQLPTPSATPVPPSQTPGGATPTPVPSNTATSPPQNTPTTAATATAVPPSSTSVPPSSTPSTPVPSPTPCMVTFSDVPPDHTFYAFVRCLACRGILGGYTDGTFRPNNEVTRGQLSKVVSNAAGFSETPGTWTFQDVPPGSTFYLFIERMSARGIIGGYPCGGPLEPCVPPDNRPYFRPNANATRGQISKIVSEAAGFTDAPGPQLFEDVPEGSTFFVWIQRLANRGIMGGYPCGGPNEPCIPPVNRPYFRPNANATRGQTAKIVANTFFPNCQTPAGR